MADDVLPVTQDAPPRPSARAQSQALWILAICGFALISGIVLIRVFVPGADKAETFLATITQALLSIETGIGGFYFGSSYAQQQQAKP
jgi:hypothetical protein